MSYLQQALDLLQKRAYFSAQLDWPTLISEVQTLAPNPNTPAEAYPAIRHIISALNALHNHHFFIGADEKATTGPQGQPVIFGLRVLSPEWVITEVLPDSAASDAGLQLRDKVLQVNGETPMPSPSRVVSFNPEQPLTLTIQRGDEIFTATLTARPLVGLALPYGRYLGDGVGYLELFMQIPQHQQQPYIESLQAGIRDNLAAGAQAWVVDLRRNRGGNMWPMLTGLGPLLGNGQLGCFVDADGSTTRWFYQDGTTSYQRTADAEPVAYMHAEAPVPTLNYPPLAILTSEFTGSSGEMTLISALGRPNLRTFGEVTSGEITGVAIHDLEDGALLGIAESLTQDRLGRTYPEAIAPDELIKVDWKRYNTPDDPLIQQAVAWVKTTPSL